MEKRCCRCCRYLPTTEFPKLKSSKDGLFPRCKKCCQKCQKIYYWENTEKEANRALKRDKIKFKKYQQKYYAKIKNKIIV